MGRRYDTRNFSDHKLRALAEQLNACMDRMNLLRDRYWSRKAFLKQQRKRLRKGVIARKDRPADAMQAVYSGRVYDEAA